MPAQDPRNCIAHADAVADAVCFRRLANAILTVVAIWSLYGALRHGGLEIGSALWWRPLTITVTLAAASFSLWSVTIGDRKTWAHAYHAATEHEAEPEG